MSYEIQVEVLPGGKLPHKANSTDAGFDVFATEDITIYPGEVLKHPLNIRMKIPTGCYLSIESKSGLGARGLLVFAGVIDEGYRGIPHVVMTNLLYTEYKCGDMVNQPIVIRKGDKLAQIIPFPFSTAYFMTQVESVDTDTSRSTGGFGSSGTK